MVSIVKYRESHYVTVLHMYVNRFAIFFISLYLHALTRSLPDRVLLQPLLSGPLNILQPLDHLLKIGTFVLVFHLQRSRLI